MISRLNNTSKFTPSFGRPGFSNPFSKPSEPKYEFRPKERTDYAHEKLVSQVEEILRLNRQSRRKLAEDIVNTIKREVR